MTDCCIPETSLDDGVLTLRPWDPDSESDVTVYLTGVTDAEFTRWNTPDKPISSFAESRASLRRRADERLRGVGAAFCVADANDGKVMGQVAINAIAWNIKRAVVSYWLLPHARGRHLSARALELATLWAYDSLGLHRLELYHAVGNQASCRIAERCGYAHEGVLRDRMFQSGDRSRYRDAHLHARLATDPHTTT